MDDFYKTIGAESFTEYKDRGSRFLAFAFPVQSIEAFKIRLKAIKEIHPKASHHCFAYRIGADKQTFRASDDGEPSGTAGKPILSQIDAHNFTNSAVVVVRYFGGTLLGVPGLIHAYKTAASLVLQLSPAETKPILVVYECQYNYTHINEIMMLIKRYDCVIIEHEQQLFSRIVLGIPKNMEASFLENAKEPQLEIKKA